MLIYMDAESILDRVPSLEKNSQKSFISRLFNSILVNILCTFAIFYSYYTIRSMRKSLSRYSERKLIAFGPFIVKQILFAKDSFEFLHNKLEHKSMISDLVVDYLEKVSISWGDFAEDIDISSDKRCRNAFAELGAAFSKGTK